MKQSWEWDEEDIIALVNDKVTENINLDYKACDSLIRNSDKKKDELSKDISAFANSAGGTVIYGVKEQGNIPLELDVGYDPNDISREWIEQVINSRIHRKIDGIRINQIILDKTSPGKVIYVVHIPQSKRAPHMASDHRYYKRFNFESVPMEEYEVRDVSRRNEVPDLRIIYSLEDAENKRLVFDNTTHEEGKTIYSNNVDLYVSITNEAPKPAEYIVIRLFIDSRINTMPQHGVTIKKDLFYQTETERISISLLSTNWGTPGKLPVWEGINFSLLTDPLKISFPQEPGDYIIGWELKSPGMNTKSEIRYMRFDGEKIFLTEEQSYVLDKNND